MSGALNSAGRAAFSFAFEISPIILAGGIAQLTFGYLPIVAITEGIPFINGLLQGNAPLSLSDFFAHFVPLPNGRIVANAVGAYPFANQQVAANAMIFEPLSVSLLMIAPVKDDGGYAERLATMVTLRAVIADHVAKGGIFHVATPAMIYPNMLLTGITDVSDDRTKQKQALWQWDFVQPLITQSDAQQAYNGLMQNLANGTQISGQPSYSGIGNGLQGSVLTGANPPNPGAFASFPATPAPVTASPLGSP